MLTFRDVNLDKKKEKNSQEWRSQVATFKSDLKCVSASTLSIERQTFTFVHDRDGEHHSSFLSMWLIAVGNTSTLHW